MDNLQKSTVLLNGQGRAVVAVHCMFFQPSNISSLQTATRAVKPLKHATSEVWKTHTHTDLQNDIIKLKAKDRKPAKPAHLQLRILGLGPVQSTEVPKFCQHPASQLCLQEDPTLLQRIGVIGVSLPLLFFCTIREV